MFKTILVPTDGSERSLQAVRAAVEFARDEHASIIGLYALNVDEYRPRMQRSYFQSAREDLEREVEERRRQHAEHALNDLADVALRAGVPCAMHIRDTHEAPHEAIVREAEEDHCDLIFMASDAAHGLASWFTPSEATKVMTYAKIPVMLYRH
jgi:nucleotide-binding universal stress UspA family protein